MYSSAEIETIVQVVLQRLDAAARGRSDVSATPSTKGGQAAAKRGILQLTDKLITLEAVAGRLDGLQCLQVLPKAVVTPAVLDELRDRSIQLERASQVHDVLSQPRFDQLLIIAAAEHRAESQAIAEFAAVSQNQAADVRRIVAHLNSGGKAAIWNSCTPFAAIRAACGHTKLAAIQIWRIEDLERAIGEAEPNLLILDSSEWDSSKMVELADRWRRSL